MENTIESKKQITSSSNIIFNFEVETTIDEGNNMVGLIKTVTKTALSLVILNQTVLPTSEVRLNEDDPLKNIYSTFNTNENFDSLFRATSPTNLNYLIESEGDTTMSDDVRQKDLNQLEVSTKKDIDNLKELMNEKFDHTDTKILNAISDLKNEMAEQKERDRVTNRNLYIGIAGSILIPIILHFFF